MKDKMYWDGVVNSVNILMGILKRKPRQFKSDYQCSPRGILNAYREGDVTFDQAVKQIENWKDRQVTLALKIYQEPSKPISEKPDDLLVRSVEDLEISVRAVTAFRSTNIRTIGDLVQVTEKELRRKTRFTTRIVREVVDVLGSLGLSLGLKVEDGKIVKPEIEEDDEIFFGQ